MSRCLRLFNCQECAPGVDSGMCCGGGCGSAGKVSIRFLAMKGEGMLHNCVEITTFAVPILSKRKSPRAAVKPLAWLRVAFRLV